MTLNRIKLKLDENAQRHLQTKKTKKILETSPLYAEYIIEPDESIPIKVN